MRLGPIFNGEIDLVWIWFRVPRITVSTGIETSDNALATTEVMPPRRDSSPRVVEDGGVVGSRLIDVRNRHNNAEESNRGHIATLAGLRDHRKRAL